MNQALEKKSDSVIMIIFDQWTPHQPSATQTPHPIGYDFFKDDDIVNLPIYSEPICLSTHPIILQEFSKPQNPEIVQYKLKIAHPKN